MKLHIPILIIALSLISVSASAQGHQEIESPTADVLSLNSTGSTTTTLNFLNSDGTAPVDNNDKRAYISTNGNVLTFGLSNNNTGGSMQWFSDGATRMTMASDGRLGLGIIPSTSSLFQVEGESPDIATIVKKSGTNTNGSVLILENNSTGQNLNQGLYAIVNGDTPAGNNNYNIAVTGWANGAGDRLIGVQGQAKKEGLAGRFLGRVKTTLSHTIGEHPTGVTPEEGTIQYNSIINDFEGYNGLDWLSFTDNCNQGTEITSLPYTIFDPGYYYLSQDLTYTGGANAISISTPNVTVDLKGYSLLGNGSTSSIGIVATRHDVNIVNGIINNFGIGLLVGSGTLMNKISGATISNIKARNNSIAGFRIGTVEGLLLKNCSAIDNGIGFAYSENSSNRAQNVTFLDCQSYNNSSIGFAMDQGHRFINCSSNENGSSGFDVGEKCSFFNCEASNNGSNGFKSSNNGSLFRYCIANDNDNYGFNLDNNSVNYFHGNSTSNNDDGSIYNSPSSQYLIDNFFF